MLSIAKKSFYWVVLFLCIPFSAPAAETEGDSLGATIVEDYKYVATAPARWEAEEWKNLGWAALTVVGTSLVADRPVRDFMRQQPKDDAFLNEIENFGQGHAFRFMGVYYLTGLATDNKKTVQVSHDLITASMISATINQSLKTLSGRYRPREDQGVTNFQGYVGIKNNSSFPSGHATEAFTLAAVLATHYEDTWVSYVAYSTAGVVAVARMYNDAHWASDVTASAFLGIWVGKSIVQHNNSKRATKVVALPMVGSDYTGVQIIAAF